jgi:hypothetical protein
MAGLRDEQGYSSSISGTVLSYGKLGGQIYEVTGSCADQRSMRCIWEDVQRAECTWLLTYGYHRRNEGSIREEVSRPREAAALTLDRAAVLV